MSQEDKPWIKSAIATISWISAALSTVIAAVYQTLPQQTKDRIGDEISDIVFSVRTETVIVPSHGWTEPYAIESGMKARVRPGSWLPQGQRVHAQGISELAPSDWQRAGEPQYALLYRINSDNIEVWKKDQRYPTLVENDRIKFALNTAQNLGPEKRMIVKLDLQAVHAIGYWSGTTFRILAMCAISLLVIVGISAALRWIFARVLRARRKKPIRIP